jgi:hypothetical protein
MGQQNDENYQDQTSGNPPQKTAAARKVDKESDDAYFARGRERRDPAAPENLNENDRGGTQKAEPDDRQEWGKR